MRDTLIGGTFNDSDGFLAPHLHCDVHCGFDVVQSSENLRRPIRRTDSPIPKWILSTASEWSPFLGWWKSFSGYNRYTSSSLSRFLSRVRPRAEPGSGRRRGLNLPPKEPDVDAEMGSDTSGLAGGSPERRAPTNNDLAVWNGFRISFNDKSLLCQSFFCDRRCRHRTR